MQQKPYWRLSDSEREEISRGIEAGRTFANIAQALGRHASTISRAVRRNSGKSGYRAFSAARRGTRAAASRRKGKSVLAKEHRLRAYVLAGLTKRWSPREVVIRMKAEYPSDMTMRISPEAVYRYIYVLPRGTLKTTLIKGLRQERAYRRKRHKGDHDETRGKIADMLSIEERPKEVEDRAAPGGRTWIAQRRDVLRRYALELRLTSACGVNRLSHGEYRHQQSRYKACEAN